MKIHFIWRHRLIQEFQKQHRIWTWTIWQLWSRTIFEAWPISNFCFWHLIKFAILKKVCILFKVCRIQGTVPIRKTRFFSAHFMKLPVAPMISKIHKQYVPHLKDLKLSFKLRYQTFQKSSRLKFFRLNFKSWLF